MFPISDKENSTFTVAVGTPTYTSSYQSQFTSAEENQKKIVYGEKSQRTGTFYEHLLPSFLSFSFFFFFFSFLFSPSSTPYFAI
jgi:hypothetical protein